jgi:hypothetical protein
VDPQWLPTLMATALLTLAWMVLWILICLHAAL